MGGEIDKSSATYVAKEVIKALKGAAKKVASDAYYIFYRFFGGGGAGGGAFAQGQLLYTDKWWFRQKYYTITIYISPLSPQTKGIK